MAELSASPQIAGEATGPVLALSEPISLWGGVDPATGRIIDARHPLHGASVTGTVLVMPSGRGSSSSSSVLAEMIRRGTAPAAIVLGRGDLVYLVGALVAAELYGKVTPVAVLRDLGRLARSRYASIRSDGKIEIS